MNPAETTSAVAMRDVAVAAPQGIDVAEVEGINWQAGIGDFWVVGGMQGSGKSAFISTAAGLQRPLRGTALLFGKDFFALHETELLRERKRIGVVFENGGRMFSRLTVFESVALPLRYHNDWNEFEAEPPVAELLELTGLTRFAREPIAMLSPAFQQRAALARALALKPEVLFLDKPLIASRDRRWLPELLKTLSDGSSFTKGRPMAIVVTTEDLQAWAEFGKQFAILRKNQWQMIGPQAEIANRMEPILREFWSEDLNHG